MILRRQGHKTSTGTHRSPYAPYMRIEPTCKDGEIPVSPMAQSKGNELADEGRLTYSALRTDIGVTRTALSAGTSEPAKRHQERHADACGERCGIARCDAKEQRAHASRGRVGTQHARHDTEAAARRMPSAKIMRPTRDGSAPRARRTPISCDRCDTV